ncbi:hypothetical protein HPB52_005041 [Rhipicephalus sanguineus]|uniref:Uncharacterized protein n=1 Tax=Rhipicephalus sanguineus TaxID=34632 RepID=A0A9D4SUB8_RHISA|nr:hypothetical protein HPB52_005041 [Rhipicephalus sanguineus]
MRRYKAIEAPDKGVQTVLDARERRVSSGGRWRCGNGVEAMCPRVVRHSVSHFSECVYWDISCSHENRDHALREALEEQLTQQLLLLRGRRAAKELAQLPSTCRRDGSCAATLKYQLSRRLRPEVDMLDRSDRSTARSGVFLGVRSGRIGGRAGGIHAG